MTATVEPPTCSVVLRFASCSVDDVAALRQQLALCLATGITHIRVDVRSLDDLDAPAMQALQGVAGYLQRKGGGLTLTGAGPGVVATLSSSHLEHLLPAAPSLAGPAQGRSAPPAAFRASARELTSMDGAR